MILNNCNIKHNQIALKQYSIACAIISLFITSLLFSTKLLAQTNNYPYWGAYKKTPLQDVRLAKWNKKDTIVEGWDWSLPENIKPSSKARLTIARSFGLTNKVVTSLPEIKFPVSPIIAFWVNWSLLEPEEGKFNFEPLINNIKEAAKKGYGSYVRVHSSSINTAPDWIKKYKIPIRKEKKVGEGKVNYEVSHPKFHSSYVKLVEALGKSGIPYMNEVKTIYAGYASPSNGDEGIGPYPYNMSSANDTVQHVMERLDEWASACKGVESKVLMGGFSNYGIQKGFGFRRGFIEIYLYHIPDEEIGQKMDKNGYLYVDESNPIIANNVYQGEVNEEYEEMWATAKTKFRYGQTTESFPYRYFTSNLRALQMRCNDFFINDFTLMPEMLAWFSLGLGKTVQDAPDAWCFLRESYLKENKGIPIKNFERWIYQRDKPGYETKPAVKINHAIQMWMVQPGQYFDYVAREGNKIGFDVEDKWKGVDKKFAVKISYFDLEEGTMNLLYKKGNVDIKKSISLIRDGKLKTATFFIDVLKKNAMLNEYDFVLASDKINKNITVSFLRVIPL